jgi:hypothetical protein
MVFWPPVVEEVQGAIQVDLVERVEGGRAIQEEDGLLLRKFSIYQRRE